MVDRKDELEINDLDALRLISRVIDAGVPIMAVQLHSAVFIETV